MEPLGSHLLVILSDPQLKRGFERMHSNTSESRLRPAIARALHKLATQLEPKPSTHEAAPAPLIPAWQG